MLLDNIPHTERIVCSIGREGKVNIWLLFETLEIVVNFIRITYTLYIDLIEILNSELGHNFSWAERQRQEDFDMQHSLATAHSFYVGICSY